MLEPSGNLLRRPQQPKLVGYDASQRSVLNQLAALGPTALAWVLFVVGVAYLACLCTFAVQRGATQANPPQTNPQQGSYILLRRAWLPLAVALLFFTMVLRFDLGSALSAEHPWWASGAGRLFFYERATNLTSGVSPVLPPLFLGLGFFWWGYARLNRLFFLDCYHVEVPFPEDGPVGLPGTREFQALKTQHTEAMDVLRRTCGTRLPGSFGLPWPMCSRA